MSVPQPASEVRGAVRALGVVRARASAAADALFDGPPTLPRLTGRVAMLLVVAIGLEVWLMRFTHLPQASYTLPTLLAELLARLASPTPVSLLTLAGLAAAVVGAVRTRSLGPCWSDFELGTRLRALIVFVASVLAWVYATYGYNHYFGQGHELDRLLLLLAVPLLAWRPAFVFAFLLVLLPLVWQFTYPLGGFSWAAPMLLIRVLFLFAALWSARALTWRLRTADFVFLLCCLIAAHYWVSGLGKLALGWLARDQIGLLLPATYANGWLAFLEPEQVGELTRMLLWVNGPMKLATLLIEGGALFALWRRATLRLFFLAWIALHASIFLVTGILFWQWMLLHAAVLLLFFRNPLSSLPIFTRAHFLLSLVLIGGGALWFRPARLAWLDARVSYTYRVEAVGESGRTYALPPRFFAPYDYQFTLSNFRYLTPAPHLAITWGATYQVDLAAALEEATTPAQVLALEAAMGHNAFDAQRSAAFDDFVQRFIDSWHRRGGAGEWWTPLQAPPLLWTFARGAPPSAADPIVRVVVYQVTSLFDGARYLEIRNRPVRRIPLRPAPGGDPPRNGMD